MLEFFRFGDHDLPLPAQATDGAAGYDLRAVEDVHILPQQFKLIKVGFGVELELGLVGLIRDRSSLACKGLTTRGGVIDCDYRGEIGVILVNESDHIQHIDAGDRIAQLVVLHCIMELPQEIALPSATDRGTNGFGSTGR